MTHQSTRWLLPHPFATEQEPDDATRAALLLARADRRTMALARRCANALSDLAAEAGTVHFWASAVTGAALEDTTPERWLESALAHLKQERAAGRAEARLAEQRAKEDAARQAPFTSAVGAIANRAAGAREGAIRALDALRGVNSPALAPEEADVLGRWRALVGAGLTQTQLDLAMPGMRARVQAASAQEAVEKRAEHEATVRAADRVLVAVRAWSAAPLHDVQHLRGVCDELDGVLAQYAPAEAAS